MTFFSLLLNLLAILAVIFLRCFRILICRIILRIFCFRTRLYGLWSLLPCGFLDPVTKSVGSLAKVLSTRLYLLPNTYLSSFHLVICSKPVSNLLPYKGLLPYRYNFFLSAFRPRAQKTCSFSPITPALFINFILGSRTHVTCF